jgi:hypothetical protein
MIALVEARSSFQQKGEKSRVYFLKQFSHTNKFYLQNLPTP